MGTAVEFGILGPLSVRVGEGQRVPRQAKLRALLALLLVRARTTVTTAQLVDDLWEDDPPATAITALQVHVCNLRHILCPGLRAADPGQLLVTRHQGYVLAPGPDRLDLDRFRARARTGATSLGAGDVGDAAVQFAAALDQWRGPALADVSARTVRELYVPALEEERTSVVERLSEALLALDRSAEAAARLTREIRIHPLREHLAALTVTALRRSGRAGEAGVVYDRTRRLLADELGLDPGPELRALATPARASSASPEARSEDLALEPLAGALPPPAPRSRRRSAASGPGRTAVAASLPPPVPHFTGRAAELDALTGMVRPTADPTPVVEVVGAGGSGKTALAVQLAHRIGDRFPDGVLWLSLRGSTASPVGPSAAVLVMLRRLGVDPTLVPRSLPERTRLLRSQLTGRRVLVVLDDAANEGQVRCLLPASVGSAVLMTTRKRLVGLDGVQTTVVRPLPPPDAVRLLVHLVGPERVGAEPEAASTIARLCGRLPLAVRIAGARIAGCPGQPLTGFAAELADERRRLDLLTDGDRAVRTTLATALRGCPAADRTVFALLARLRLGDVPAWTAAALLGTDLWWGVQIVDRLADAHLLHMRGVDALGQPRYQQHDLVRLFAAEQVDVPGAPEVGAALGRLIGALAALYERAEHCIRAGGVPAPALPPAVLDHLDAGLVATVETDPVGWAAGELELAVAALGQAQLAGADAEVLLLAPRLAWFLELRGDPAMWQDVLRIAGAAAGRTGDGASRIWVLTSGGDLERARHRIGAAVAAYARARAVARRAGARLEVARLGLRLASVYAHQGPLRRAAVLLDEVEPVLAAHGDDADRVQLDVRRGLLSWDRGQPVAAEGRLRAATALATRRGDRRAVNDTRHALARVLVEQGRLGEAVPLLEACLAGHRALRDRRAEHHVQLDLARVDLLQRRPEAAADRLDRCDDAFGRMSDRPGRAHVQLLRAEVLQAQDRTRDALSLLRSARSRFAGFGAARDIAEADVALGHVYAAAGRGELAAEYLLDAAERLSRIGLVERAAAARDAAARCVAPTRLRPSV